ncbi:MAG TPA: BrnA antitoxin family protein [Microvirga sp.]|jgi:uncharacterized protein (DUF4415 family)|nr:BrnA antitoxin family protein [Microvirga sp.]
MRNSRKPADYQPNPHYTKEDWEEVSDNPELTNEQLAALRPAHEVLPPALYEALTRRRPGQRGPGKARPKVAVTLRLDPDIVDAFKAGGAGWQTRINETLKEALSDRPGRRPIDGTRKKAVTGRGAAAKAPAAKARARS